ncbi:MAG: ACT domain-containing protein, partial [Candidatus Omnitrophota bacterium]|nr:ACT domain-containing protein [Candidatus Omnitrophota bacterium]
IIVTVMNKVGVLADMAKILADHGINIEAVKGYAEDGQAKIMLITDDNLRTMDALKKNGYKGAVESEMIMLELENKPGALKYITGKLASEEIDIKFIYGTTCPGGCPAKIILSTSNNEKALVAFKAK